MFESDDTDALKGADGTEITDAIKLKKHALKHGDVDLKTDPIYNVFLQGIEPVKKLFNADNVSPAIKYALCKVLFALSLSRNMLDFYNDVAGKLTEENNFFFLNYVMPLQLSELKGPLLSASFEMTATTSALAKARSTALNLTSQTKGFLFGTAAATLDYDTELLN
ncbi:MAG: hypothetical protein QMC37_02570, partial [Flavobacteriales bacterium]